MTHFKRPGPRLSPETLGLKVLTLESQLAELKAQLLETPEFLQATQPSRFILPSRHAAIDAAWRSWVGSSTPSGADPTPFPGPLGPESRPPQPEVHPFIAPEPPAAKRHAGRQSRLDQDLERDAIASWKDNWVADRIIEDWGLNPHSPEDIHLAVVVCDQTRFAGRKMVAEAWKRLEARELKQVVVQL
jgi:hypothetical protein